MTDCHKIVNRLAYIQQVETIWIFGNCDFDGNEEAYRLTKEGSARAIIGPELALRFQIQTRVLKERRSKLILSNGLQTRKGSFCQIQ